MCPVIGISVRYWNEDRSELNQLAQCLRIINEQREVEFRFLPFHTPADEEASQYVIKQMGISPSRSSHIHVAEEADILHPQDMLAQIGACDLLIGMRLHSLIYAAAQYVPMLGISYDPKIDQFLQRLQLQAVATTSCFDPVQVAAEAMLLLDTPHSEWMRQKSPLIDQLKLEAHRPAGQIVSFFSHAFNTI
jgi:polysaccharide pyruvyl transferase WcaK-like protein